MTLTLPPGKSESEAIRIARGHLLACKRAHPNDETRALTEFGEITRRMCNGDVESGRRLAGLAVWSVEP